MVVGGGREVVEMVVGRQQCGGGDGCWVVTMAY